MIDGLGLNDRKGVGSRSIFGIDEMKNGLFFAKTLFLVGNTISYKLLFLEASLLHLLQLGA